MPLNWRFFCSMQLYWFLVMALSSMWVKNRIEPLSGRRRKILSTQLTRHVSALGCLDMCNGVAFSIWPVFDLGNKLLTSFPLIEICVLWMDKTSLILSKQWYAIEKRVENKTLSYDDLQIVGNAYMTLCKMDKVKGIRGSIVTSCFLWRPCKTFLTMKGWV